MPKSKLSGLKQQLRVAEEDVQLKTRQLQELRDQVAVAREKIERLEGEVNTNAVLEDDVQALLRHQQETASAFMDYENRVLALELQGLVDRWRAMDIEELSQQNHDLREECMRLQQENMQLSRAVAENSLSARRDLAKIESALEMTVKQKMREMHDRLRQELYDELDDKTKKMVAEHGYLQDYVREQAAQAGSLDRHCRMLQADRARFKVDSDVATSLSEQQAAQAVGLRRQLKQAYLMVEALRRRLAESEARAQAAWDEAVRASSRAAVAAAAAARAGLRGGDAAAAAAAAAEVDADSAYGMAGEGAEVAALESQLRHARQRFERMRLQRDRWRDRSTLYEKACAQLQAALQTLQDQARLSLPGGVKQDLDAIWCAAKAAEAAVDGGAAAAGPRPSTPYLYSGASTPVGGVGGVGGGGGGGGGRGDWDGKMGQWSGFRRSSPSIGGGGGWPVGGGAAAAAAGAARARAASARVASSGWQQGESMPARPRTAAPRGEDGGGGGGSGGAAAAAWRAAEAIRASVALNPPLPPPPLSPPPEEPHGGGNGGGGGGGALGLEGADDAAAAAAAATRGSLSLSPGRAAAMSRLYSNEAEPFKLLPKVQYDQIGWPVRPELSPSREANRTGGGVGSPESRRPSTAAAATQQQFPQSQQSQQQQQQPQQQHHYPQQQQQLQPQPAAATSALQPTAPLTSPLAASLALTSPPVSARRTPGSMRPHSAVELSPTSTSTSTPRWSIGKSLTGLTSAIGDAAADDDDGAGGGSAAAAASASREARQEGSPPPPPHQQQQQDARSTSPQLRVRRSAAAAAGADPEPLLRSPVGATRSGRPQRTVSYAVEADRQDWRARRSRSQSPEYAAIARATAATAAVMALEERQSGSVPPPPPPAAAEAAEAETATPVLPPRAVPEVGLSGGALYTVVHNIAVSAAGAAAAAAPAAGSPDGSAHFQRAQQPPSGGGGGGPLAAMRALQALGAAAAAVGGGAAAAAAATDPGSGSLGNPSVMLTALKRPPPSLKRLHNPDVMFTGRRASSARGGAVWEGQQRGAVPGSGSGGGGLGSGGGSGGGSGVWSASTGGGSGAGGAATTR
ncbi:hypothetical protein PLESTB_001793400 [Pleodorina starrii]|uniref:Uncharacterized protein n=1 Tax=Pleodorina starrii TaxID=330485 RepID=A0A9W6C0V7_9CHLO|nr:hypothetical protein PLESTM_001157600 [Pleodorina starrii]GLC61699.1 hypothetical protein PLESTB_001793400 [Pleodorina starrii]GLC69178.1 hypothetical protein PLESTF_000799000 [Pleodorina starrii]